MIRLWLAVLAVMTIGCDDHKILSGQWFSEEPMPLYYFQNDGQVTSPVYVELTLGHYGKDVVGIVRYYNKAVQLPGNLRQCDGAQVPQECSCNEVMGDYHIKKQRFRFYLDPFCADSGGDLVEMVLVDDDTLRWTVPAQDGQSPEQVYFERVLEEKALTKSHKLCAACQ